ncbi:sugar transferase [Pontibacter harenae]|uniref:sugar transferase n=1 Tax=Pontibacter harenae TaxID=2894083 RepID=UPI001E5FF08E|nr:sugar transferase [Pontibacter harenae]MCC9166066.1 sugar transferase [Pontibacter harenae]
MYQKYGKRLIDVVLALGILLISLPMLLAVAVLLAFANRGAILFKQQRPGLQGKPFYIYKFKTMTDARDAHGFLLPDSHRLTLIGTFVRKTSLDEIPQLFNVLCGDMSLVGPRPLLMEYLPLYTPQQARRHEVKPGITGWAQVNGRNAISWENKFGYDVWYVEHFSFKTDVLILAKTMQKVLVGADVNTAGYTTAPKFESLSS